MIHTDPDSGTEPSPMPFSHSITPSMVTNSPAALRYSNMMSRHDRFTRSAPVSTLVSTHSSVLSAEPTPQVGNFPSTSRTPAILFSSIVGTTLRIIRDLTPGLMPLPNYSSTVSALLHSLNNSGPPKPLLASLMTSRMLESPTTSDGNSDKLIIVIAIGSAAVVVTFIILVIIHLILIVIVVKKRRTVTVTVSDNPETHSNYGSMNGRIPVASRSGSYAEPVDGLNEPRMPRAVTPPSEARGHENSATFRTRLRNREVSIYVPHAYCRESVVVTAWLYS